MTTHRDVLADAVLETKTLLGRYLKGFAETPDGGTRQAPGLPNHVSWSLGHLALTMHRVAEMLDHRPLPESDFVGPSPGATQGKPDPAARGDARRFHADSVAFASQPTADTTRYPGAARAVEIFHAACDRLASAVRGASDADLSRKVKWGPGEQTVLSLIPRMIFHNGMHAGQIADLRRGLSMGSIFS